MQPGNTNIGLTCCLPRYSFISFTRSHIQYRQYRPHVTNPRMSTVVGFSTFLLPGRFGGKPGVAGASAIDSSLSSFRSGFRRRSRRAGLGAAAGTLGKGVELLLVAARAR